MKRKTHDMRRQRAKKRPGRASFGHRVYRFLRDRAPAPRRRFRVVNRKRFIIAQAVLAAIVVGALALSASVIARSIRTARLNRELASLYVVNATAMEAEIAAPPIEEAAFTAKSGDAAYAPYGALSAMVMPDGTPINAPMVVASDETGAELATATGAFYRTDLDILPEMRELTQKNPDTVGWISIPGTVHLPVVYRDNTYYLDHDFTGAKNASGTLFLDEASPIGEGTQNLLIHGHAMNDGSMFGILTHYRRLDFLKEHPLITFNTLWEKGTYAVAEVLRVSSKVGDANYFNYFSNPAFESVSDFDEYRAQLEARSRYAIPVDIQPTDALITLSTCLDDDRLVVIARRLRPGETRDEIASTMELAY